MNKKKLSIGLITLSLITTFSLTTLTKAEDFAGKEEKYIKLCSSSKLTNKIVYLLIISFSCLLFDLMIEYFY